RHFNQCRFEHAVSEVERIGPGVEPTRSSLDTTTLGLRRFALCHGAVLSTARTRGAHPSRSSACNGVTSRTVISGKVQRLCTPATGGKYQGSSTSSLKVPGTTVARPPRPGGAPAGGAGGGANEAAATYRRCSEASRPMFREPTGVMMLPTT